jgi:hypothetical protein
MQAFVNVGFSGTVSLVTGASAAPLALSQIGVANPDASFGPQRNGRGVPFVFLLRDLLQDQPDLDGVRRALEAANRTLDLILGFGAPANTTISNSSNAGRRRSSSSSSIIPTTTARQYTSDNHGGGSGGDGRRDAGSHAGDKVVAVVDDAAAVPDGAPFMGVQYAADQVRFYDDKNMLPVNATWHPHVQDAGAYALHIEWIISGRVSAE